MGTLTLTIKNVSKEYISVCAEKDWGNTAYDGSADSEVGKFRNRHRFPT